MLWWKTVFWWFQTKYDLKNDCFWQFEHDPITCTKAQCLDHIVHWTKMCLICEILEKEYRIIEICPKVYFHHLESARVWSITCFGHISMMWLNFLVIFVLRVFVIEFSIHWCHSAMFKSIMTLSYDEKQYFGDSRPNMT